MKNPTLKERTENAFNAFFENELLSQNSAIVIAVNQALTPLASEHSDQKADKYFGFFKKIFAFAPGVLFLHLAVPATAMFGFGLWGLFWFSAGIFMIWAGIGDLKNKKRLLLPLSVIAMAVIFSAPFGFPSAAFASYYIYFYIGILPLLFIAPILTKSVIEKFEENETGLTNLETML